MRAENAGSLSVALARASMRLRCLSSANGRPPVTKAPCSYNSSSALPLSRITLTDGLACLDRKAERRGICELETDDGMRNPWRTPVIYGQIDVGHLRDPHGARFPVRRVISVGAIIAVADVVKSEFVTVDV